MEKCTWTYQNDNVGDYYETACDHAFVFNEGQKESKFKFCPYCGKVIDEVIPEREEEDES